MVQKTIQATDIVKYGLKGNSVFLFHMLYTRNSKMEKNKNTIDRLFPMENKVYRSGIRISGNEIIIAQSNNS
ncbi:hypothetical protein ACSV5T_08600 [Veillonella sp. ZSJB6]|uniref:hypothetical protein n=1 Tax=Veillonella sp. ZSJB6 TaxID=3451359 RepID=UPI003EE6FCB4